jgi:hypothetical protein
MREHTKDQAAALRGQLADLTADDANVDALREIVSACLDLLDAQTTAIVTACSIIAMAPADRRIVGFASDAIEAAHKSLSAIEAIDGATDILLVPYADRYESVAHSVKAAS